LPRRRLRIIAGRRASEGRAVIGGRRRVIR
jgi:hypothetical protein